MRVTQTDESTPNTDLQAAIHQHHRGLTVVALRRKGRGSFAAIELEGKDGAPVGHKEAPTDKPVDVARIAFEKCSTHAQEYGPGVYECELRFASGERGAPPKPVIVPIAIGADAVDIGNGPDASVFVDIAIRMADFCSRKLEAFMAALPAIAKGTTDNLVALQTIGEQMLTAQRELAASNTTVELARIDARKQSDRTALTREIVAPGLEVVKRALGLGPSAAQTMKQAAQAKPTKAVAAASPASSSSTVSPEVSPSSTTSSAPASDAVAPEVNQLDEALAETLKVGRELGASLSESQMTRLADLLGLSFDQRIRSLATIENHSDVFQLIVDLVEAGDAVATEALGVLTNEQTSLVLKVRELADTVAKLRSAVES